MRVNLRDIPLREALHYLGWKGSPIDGQTLEQLKETIALALRHIDPVITMRRFLMEENGALKGTSFYPQGEDMRKMLSSCSEAVLVAATLGAQSERLLLQLYPEKSGGCELYVTRLEMELGEETAVRRDNENKALVLSDSLQLRDQANELAFSFEDLRAVSMACRELKSCAFSGESSLYFGKNKKYYLFLCEADENKKGPSTELLSEFGEPEIRAEISTLMLEYGKCVMDRCAVETLSEI